MSENNCIIPLKRCSKCGEDKPAIAEYFYNATGNRDGLRTECKICTRKHMRLYRVKHREQVLENKRQYHAKNAAKEHERSKRYRTTNIEKERARGKRNRQSYPEKGRDRARRRTAIKASLISTFTTEHEQLALEYFNGRCAVCGRQLKDLFNTHTVHWDHWIPQIKGGHTTPDNMIPLCGGQGGCNNSKGAKDACDWLSQRYGKRKASNILARIDAYFEWVKGQ